MKITHFNDDIFDIGNCLAAIDSFKKYYPKANNDAIMNFLTQLEYSNILSTGNGFCRDNFIKNGNDFSLEKSNIVLNYWGQSLIETGGDELSQFEQNLINEKIKGYQNHTIDFKQLGFEPNIDIIPPLGLYPYFQKTLWHFYNIYNGKNYYTFDDLVNSFSWDWKNATKNLNHGFIGYLYQLNFNLNKFKDIALMKPMKAKLVALSQQNGLNRNKIHDILQLAQESEKRMISSPHNIDWWFNNVFYPDIISDKAKQNSLF